MLLFLQQLQDTVDKYPIAFSIIILVIVICALIALLSGPDDERRI